MPPNTSRERRPSTSSLRRNRRHHRSLLRRRNRLRPLMQPSETGAIVGPQPYAVATSARLIAAGYGLDWLNLLVANVQTGFGPFIAVYLTTQGWTQTAIGTALSLGTVVAMASQVPAGALVDVMQSKVKVAAASILVFTLSALLIATVLLPLFVYLAEILLGFSSCMLGPAI